MGHRKHVIGGFLHAPTAGNFSPLGFSHLNLCHAFDLTTGSSRRRLGARRRSSQFTWRLLSFDDFLCIAGHAARNCSGRLLDSPPSALCPCTQQVQKTLHSVLHGPSSRQHTWSWPGAIYKFTRADFTVVTPCPLAALAVEPCPALSKPLLQHSEKTR